MCYKREKEGYPIYDVKMSIMPEGSSPKIEPHYRGVLFRLGPKKNRFVCYAHKFLSENPFEAEISDRYPKEDRPEFPFPNDIPKVTSPLMCSSVFLMAQSCV